MSGTDNLVPEPQSSILDSVTKAVGDERTASRVMANPQLARMMTSGKAGSGEDHAHDADASGSSAPSGTSCACGSEDPSGSCACQDEQEEPISLKAFDDIGRATAQDVKEALHQVIDPELGIDVIDLGLVYGIEIDEKGRAIITMTLTTPACPLTDLIEDECASTLAGLVEEFRIDWTWQPRWTVDKITPEGRDQLAAIGFNLDNMPRY